MRIGRREVPFTHPDKALFADPAITKLQLGRYYESVAEAMVPLVRDRPLALQAFPDGIDAKGYFMKSVPAYFPDWIATATVPKRGGTLTQVLAGDAATLVYLAGQNVVTPHVWLSRADQPRCPDRLIIDLDPSPGVSFAQIRAAARAAGARLRDAGLATYAMVTGSRGLFGLGGASIRDDIQDALEDTTSPTDFSAQERLMMKNVLALHELRVVDVMVPRADIYSVSLTMTLAEVLAMFRTAGHSRLPAYGATLDDPRGMIHVRDFVDYIAGAENLTAGVDGPAVSPDTMVRSLGALDFNLPLSAARILRPVLFVPPSMPALDLLVKMQATRTHMALVIDEYGGTDGLASIEDIVEMIVGDIEDEHDLVDAPEVEVNEDGSFLVGARAALDEVSEALGTDLEAMSDAEDLETVGRPRHGAGRPCAGARRDRGQGRLRVRGARRRPAPGQAAQDLPAHRSTGHHRRRHRDPQPALSRTMRAIVSPAARGEGLDGAPVTRPRRFAASARFVSRANGWRRRLLALSAGAVGALALAPIGIGPALIVPMVVAVWLLDGCVVPGATDGSHRFWPGFAGVRLAFGAGWWLGFGYFLAGFWWLGSAFLIDPEFTWALPLGVIGVPAMLAAFMGAGFIVARLLWVRGGARVLALALGLGVSEWARGHLFTGFPWNALGMGLGGTLVTAQTAALVGLDGLTFLSIALCAAPATLADGSGPRPRWRSILVALGGLALILLYGTTRLLLLPSPGNVPDVLVRLVQPGLRPDEKFSPAYKDQIVDRYIALSRGYDAARRVGLDDVTMLVWPESAFPFILTRDPDALATIAAALPAKTTLVTGAARAEDVRGEGGGEAHTIYYNSIEVIGRNGLILDSYDKIHLVPFGEYLPLDAVLRALGLHNFVAIPGGFEPGGRRGTLDVPGLPPASPLICYEAIFPSAVMPSPGSPRAFYLLNVTNDGWFGTTAGPSQHFAQVRLRAIEEGLPLVRDAATGISAVIDPYGRILGSLPLGTEGVLDGPLPRPITPPLYARLGDSITYLIWLGTIVSLFGVRSRDLV